MLSVLLNSSTVEAGGYYCSTCKQTYDQAGSHSNDNCTGTFSQQSQCSLYFMMNRDSNDKPADEEVLMRFDYVCSACSAVIYCYEGYHFSIITGEYTGRYDRWSTEKYDSWVNSSCPPLSKSTSTMDEYFTRYGRPCKCTGNAVKVTYTVNFNKNY